MLLWHPLVLHLLHSLLAIAAAVHAAAEPPVPVVGAQALVLYLFKLL
jgi:hypothetical protein